MHKTTRSEKDGAGKIYESARAFDSNGSGICLFTLSPVRALCRFILKNSLARFSVNLCMLIVSRQLTRGTAVYSGG
jgi:hypothetical protein